MATIGNRMYNPAQNRWVKVDSFNMLPPVFRQMQAMREQRAVDDPEIGERVGRMRQFIYGTVAPIHDTLSRLNVIEQRPQPQTTGEGLAHFIGSLIGYATIFGATAGKAAPFMLKPMAGTFAGMKHGALTQSIATAGTKGAMIGAHRAWTKEEPIASGALSTAALFGTFPALGAGAKAINQQFDLFSRMDNISKALGVKVPTTAGIKKRWRGLVGGERGKLIGVDETRTFMQNVGAVPGQTLKEQRERIMDGLARMKGLDPSAVTPEDLGIRAASVWDRLTEQNKLGAIIGAMQGDPRVDTLFEPLIDITQKSMIEGFFKGKGKVAERTQNLIQRRPAVDIPQHIQDSEVAGPILERLKGANTVWDQVKGLQNTMRSVSQSKNRLLAEFDSPSLSDLLSRDLPASVLKRATDIATQEGLVQDMKWAMGGAVQRELQGRGADAIASSLLNRFRADLPGRDAGAVVWSKPFEDILKTLNEKTGLSISIQAPNARERLAEMAKHNKHAKEALGQWDSLMKSDFAPRGLTGQIGAVGHDIVPITEQMGREISGEMLVDQFAAGSLMPASYAEEMMLRTNPLPGVPLLAPLRTVLGKTLTGEFRSAVRQDRLWRESYLGDWIVEGKVMGTKGWRDHLLRAGVDVKKAGVSVQRLLQDPELDNTLKAWTTMDPTAREAVIQEIMHLKGVSAAEIQVAGEARFALDRIFKGMGLTWEKYRQAYYPHIIKLDGAKRKTVEQVFRELGEDPSVTENVLWMHELPREAETLFYDRDFFSAFPRYVVGASKKRHYDKLFEKTSEMLTKVKASDQRIQVVAELERAVLGRPAATERWMDNAVNTVAEKFGAEGLFGDRPSHAASAFLAELQYAGGIGLNPFTAVKNLTQKLLILSHAGDGKWVQNLETWFEWRQMKHTPFGEYVKQLNTIATDRQYLEGLTHMDSMMAQFADRIGKPGMANIVRGSREVGFSMFRKSDLDNVHDAFGTEFLAALKKGAPVQDAIELATSTTMATQFMYGIDSPMLYKSPLGRQLGIFMSWPLNWANLLWEQGTSEAKHKAITTVGLMAMGSEALNLTGFNFRSIHPTEVARGLWPLALMEEDGARPPLVRSGAAAHNMMQQMLKGDPDAIDRAFDRLKKTAAAWIPAGVATRRAVEMIDVYRHEWKQFDQHGRLRRELSMDTPLGHMLGIPGEAARGALGPTMEQLNRHEHHQHIQRAEAHYRRLRRQAVNAFIAGDYDRFESMQHRLMENFGRWIEMDDIHREMQLREMTPHERHAMGLPEDIRRVLLDLDEEGRPR